MAIYRTLKMTFWEDAKIVDDFTPEDKYFYIYLLTNSYTNLAGCYRLGVNRASVDTGYTKETVVKLINRLERDLDVIRYDTDTKEVLLLNWYKHNWTGSDKYRMPLKKHIDDVKNDSFREYLLTAFNGGNPKIGYGMDTYCIDTNCSDTTNAIAIANANANANAIANASANAKPKKFSKEAEGILEYFNMVTGKSIRADDAKQKIQSLLNDSYTPEDFKTVIDKKVRQWKGTDMEQYIRPSTLFAKSHFDEYLNETGERRKTTKERIQNINEEVMNW